MDDRGWERPGSGAPADETPSGAWRAARLAFAAGGMGWWRWDPAIGAVDWSPELERLYGLEPGTFAGDFDGYRAGVHPEDRDAVRARIEDAVARGVDFVVEHRRSGPDGEVWIEVRGAPVLGADGLVTEWVGLSSDVTARVERQRELRDREIESSIAFAAGRMGSWRWDAAAGRGVWSSQLEALVGVPPGTYDGSWESFVAPIVPEDHDVLRDAVVAAARGDEDFSVRYRLRRSDGAIRWVETRGRRLDASKWIGVTIDVTELAETEVAIRRNEAVLRAARDRLGETVARLDALLENASFGFAFIDVDERFVRVNDVFAGISGVTPEAHAGRPVADLVPELRAVLEAGPQGFDEVEIAVPAEDGSERYWLLARYPVGDAGSSALGVGVMAVDVTEPRRRERSLRLTTAASDLRSHTDDPDLLQRIADVAVPDFADMCVLYVEPRAGVARRFAAAHVEPALAEQLLDTEARWPQDLDRMWRAVGDRKAHLVAEVEAGVRAGFTTGDPKERARSNRLAVVSVIVVPLRAAGRGRGLVVFAHTAASGRRYRADDVDLATALGNRFAQLVENEYLGHEATRAQSRLDLLAAVSELLTVDLDSRARLEAIAHVVLPSFADDCAVYLPEEPDGIGLAAYATADADSGPGFLTVDGAGHHRIDGDAPPSVVMRTGTSMLIERVTPEVIAALDDDLDVSPRGAVAGIRSLVVVPLPGADGPIGVIAFGLRDDARAYDPGDRALAEEIARRVAPAVENALRYERESATAEALQRSLLPTTLERFVGAELAARYVPGSDGIRVGGDWYDAVTLPSGRLVLAIGDVVGHGIPAATWMGRLRTLVQFCVLDGLGPAAVLERLNDFCFAAAGSDMATALVAIYDPGRASLTFASAGHPPLAVRRVDGTVDLVWEGRGPPLCATRQARYPAAEIDLGAGEVLALYTDGLIERRGEVLDDGLERLAKALAGSGDDLEAAADDLLETLLGAGRPADDVALLLMAPAGVGADLDLELRSDARELVGLRRTFRRWLDCAGVPEDAASELVVAVNEIAGNAIEHAYGPEDETFEVHARSDGAVVTVDVADAGSWREPRSGNRGRGLAIARDLTDDLRVERAGRGTTVRMVRRIEAAG
jgi:PAS domain S-box-containing protein